MTGGVTPQRAALAVERLPALAKTILQQSGVPGMAVAVVYEDAITFAGGFGVRELGKEATIDADTVFQLASVSKSLAATVVSSVVGDGTVAWESRMADIAPGFALHDAWPTQNVSVADLFAHRSGLLDHAGDLLEDLGFDRERGPPPAALPGAGVQLSRRVCLHQLRAHRRRGRGGRGGWDDLGGPIGGAAV